MGILYLLMKCHKKMDKIMDFLLTYLFVIPIYDS